GVPFEDRDALIDEQPDVYYLADHYAPYPCVLVRLARVDPAALRDLLLMGWRFVSAQKKRPARSRRDGEDPVIRTFTAAAVSCHSVCFCARQCRRRRCRPKRQLRGVS